MANEKPLPILKQYDISKKRFDALCSKFFNETYDLNKTGDATKFQRMVQQSAVSAFDDYHLSKREAILGLLRLAEVYGE